MGIPIQLPARKPNGFDVVGFGLNMTDLLVLVDRYPEANSKQEIQQSTHCPGGQAATAMVTCARLGWKARYVGRFGDDSHGIVGLESLKTEQVDTSATRIVKETANGFSVIVVDKATGNRTIMWKRSEKLTVRPEDVDPAAVCSGRVLLVDCHDTAASAVAARHARAAGIPTVIDVEYVRPGIDELLREIDVVITSEDFPAQLTGISQPSLALKCIQTEYKSAIVCMTRGGNGSLALLGTEEISTPSFPVKVIDSTGAGDVFRGGFISAWLRAGDSTTAADIFRSANAAAAMKCRSLGARAGIPTQKELQTFLQSDRDK